MDRSSEGSFTEYYGGSLGSIACGFRTSEIGIQELRASGLT